MTKPDHRSLAFVFALLFALGALNAISQPIENVTIKKIWEEGEHNAFTDLIHFKGHFYCSFREGSGHIPGTDGIVRIIRSSDGQHWTSVAKLSKEGIDLRDPKLSITPKGKLMVIMGGSIYRNGKLEGRKPQVSFSDKQGNEFTEPEEVEIDPEVQSWGSWLWRVTWHKGWGYTIDYQIGPDERRGPTKMYLMRTKDGKRFKKVSPIELDGFPNEATVRFDADGNLHAMIRREIDDQMGVWAVSKPPFQDWRFNKMNIRLGGPNFIFDPKGRIIAGTRVYKPHVYTALFTGKPDGKFKEIVKFPASGDTSYPGLVIHDQKLWVSYYSSHEGKTSIYLAVIPLAELEMAL